MKKYTLEDFKNFEVIKGRVQCPSGDYTSIKKFPRGCSFGDCCSFGERCSFGEDCSFGEECSFGEWCSFGDCCSFGEKCSFGKECSFGEDCSFGEECSFGERCSFGEECSYNGHKLFKNPLFSVGYIGSEQRTTYAFASIDDGVRICCGCQADLSLEEFESQIKETHKDNKQYLDEYLLVVELIKVWSKRFY